MGDQKVQSENVQPSNKTSSHIIDSHVPVMVRERSFIRPSNIHTNMKRRSLVTHQQPSSPSSQFPNQIRGKPTMEVYRPPKLNYNVQQSGSSSMLYPASGGMLQHSKSSANVQQIRILGRHSVTIPSIGAHGAILVSHPIHMNHLGVGIAVQSSQHPLVNSPSSGNILHQSTHRVKFSQGLLTPQNGNNQTQQQNSNNISFPIQRSKSLSSADILARGSAGLGLALGNNVTDIGKFSTETQELIDKALNNPNDLNARSLMELTHQIMQRAVEGRRFSLPMSRLCIAIISKEHKETFLEALLNTCRQWYQEREKVLYSLQGMKSPSRSRFTSFMSFLTEMFCQLKRRELQISSQTRDESPPLILLSLIAKCCGDCVKPPVRSLSEIECLFFVLTCVGKDLETHLPQQLDALLSAVRDTFLNTSAPSIRRTLLQLIELQASRWQLPGNTVLYYYPSTK